jgi:hypothetical protein
MRLRELRESSSQLVTVNRRLNPKLWHDGELDLEVSAKLQDIAEAFEKFIGIDLPVTDYTITGSNANYTWTEHSDLDLHLIVKGTVTDAERELYNAKKALWAEQHTITVKGLPVECYVQGEQEEHHSTGVYSLVNDEWLVEPKKIKPQIDDSAVERKKDSMIHDIETALLSKNLERIRRVKERITEMRKAGLDRAGEWSVENLVFKILRNLGLIDTITEKIRELEDAELSLEQQTNVLD